MKHELCTKIELRNEELKHEDDLRVTYVKNSEIYELLKQFNDFEISNGLKLLAAWSNGLPCISYNFNRLTVFYRYSSDAYFIDFRGIEKGRYKTLDEVMNAVAWEVSRL